MPIPSAPCNCGTRGVSSWYSSLFKYVTCKTWGGKTTVNKAACMLVFADRDKVLWLAALWWLKTVKLAAISLNNFELRAKTCSANWSSNARLSVYCEEVKTNFETKSDRLRVSVCTRHHLHDICTKHLLKRFVHPLDDLNNTKKWKHKVTLQSFFMICYNLKINIKRNHFSQMDAP